MRSLSPIPLTPPRQPAPHAQDPEGPPRASRRYDAQGRPLGGKGHHLLFPSLLENSALGGGLEGSVYGGAHFLSPPPTVPPPTCQEPGGWTWGGQAKSLGPYEIKLSLCHPRPAHHMCVCVSEPRCHKLAVLTLSLAPGQPLATQQPHTGPSPREAPEDAAMPASTPRGLEVCLAHVHAACIQQALRWDGRPSSGPDLPNRPMTLTICDLGSWPLQGMLAARAAHRHALPFIQ